MSLLSSLLEIGIFSGVLFIGIMLLKSILKTKMSPFLHYVIWGLFLLRLMIPVTLEAPVHIVTYPVQAMPAAQADSIVDQENNFASQTLSDISTSQTLDNEHAEPVSVTAQAADNTTPISHPVRFTAAQTVLAVWLGGTLACLVYIFAIACLLMRRINRHAAPASAHLLRLLEEVKAELGIKAKLRLVCQYDCGSPALIFPRTLLIHMDTLASLDDEGIKNCLRHECMHYKHGDHAVNLSLTLLNCVYWFNPFVWMACHEMRKDLEVFCDSAVVKRMLPAARHDYAVLILNLSAHTRHMQLALGMARNKKTAMRRIKGIFMEPKSKRSVKLVSVVMALVLTICCFTTACQPAASEPAIVNINGLQVETQKLKNLTLPDGRYTYKSQSDKLNINVDATIVKPQADKMPIAKVKPIVLSQDMATGIFNYLFPGDKPYLLSDQLTKAEIDGQISSIEKILSLGDKNSSLLSEDQITSFNEQISQLEKEYSTAPEEKQEPGVSDGTLQRRNITIPAVSKEADGEVIDAPVSKELYELRVGLDGAHLFLQSFAAEAYPQTSILYSKTSMLFLTDAMIPISEDFEMPDAVQNNLEPSFSDAVEKANGFFAAAGIGDVKLFAAYYAENPEVGSGTPPEYTYKLIYTRTVNGVPVGCHMAGGASGQYDDSAPWCYESIELLVSDKGILDIHWDSPCTVAAIIDDDAALIDFDTAMGQFESAVTQTFGQYVDSHGIQTSIDVNINSVQLNLVRLREEVSDGTLTGLYVPAYVFYGYVKEKVTKENGSISEAYMTSTNAYNDSYPPEPFMVMAINALDGSTINTMTDIY